jgi:hypothetical protein
MLNDTTSPWVHSVSPSTEARPHAMGFCSSLGPRLRMRQVSYGDVEASIPADYKTRVNVDFMKFGVSGGRPRLRPIAPIPLSPITRFCGGWQRRPHCVGGCRRFRCELQQRQILAGLVGGASPPPVPVPRPARCPLTCVCGCRIPIRCPSTACAPGPPPARTSPAWVGPPTRPKLSGPVAAAASAISTPCRPGR